MTIRITRCSQGYVQVPMSEGTKEEDEANFIVRAYNLDVSLTAFSMVMTTHYTVDQKHQETRMVSKLRLSHWELRNTKWSLRICSSTTKTFETKANLQSAKFHEKHGGWLVLLLLQ